MDDQKKTKRDDTENSISPEFKSSKINYIELANDITIVKDFTSRLKDTYINMNNINVPSSEYFEKYIKEAHKLTKDINELKFDAAKIYVDIADGKDESEEKINDLKLKIEKLTKKEKLSFLLNRVSKIAGEKLLASEEFFELFNMNTSNSYVISIDIRKSTDMMLKAKEPALFAQFISSITHKLREIIISNNGIFDKFTGDGILAYFPDFYSGKDAGYFCAKAASESHFAFNKIYQEHRHCFTTVRTDVGLGVGIDYGVIHLEQIGGEIVIVGTPVVYACRMGAAKAGTTLINQPAYEQLFKKYSAYLDFEETELEIKHEGATLAYKLIVNPKSFEPSKPNWLEHIGRKNKN